MFFSSLLVFTQRRSNQTVANLMVLSFVAENMIGYFLLVSLSMVNGTLAYFVSTAHPISRLPVFYMGVCAGVLCIRIQEGDIDAYQSKITKISKKYTF